MRQTTYLAVPILAILFGCGETSPTPNQSKSLPTPNQNAGRNVTAPTSATPIPDDVTYTVIEESTFHNIKRSLTIRLNRRVSEEVLSAIAMKLKNSDPNRYDRTFIAYLLPGMQVNAGCWATTHFDPVMEVKILGFTVERLESLKQHRADPSREIVGCWLSESTNYPRQLTIFREDGRLFLEVAHGDGSAGIDELIETQSPHGRRFDDKPDRGHGEYYLINSKGELQQLDDDGPFMTAKKAD